MTTKPLSDKQAQACENATQPACKCRCGGTAHGANRGGTAADGSLDRAFFEGLPEDDPHYLPSDAVKKARKEIARLEKKAAMWEREGFPRTAAAFRQQADDIRQGLALEAAGRAS